MSSTSEIRREKKMYSMRPGGVVIQQTPRASMGGGGMMSTSTVRRSNVIGSSSFGAGGMMLPTGEASTLSKQAVQNVKSVRGKEKKEMSDLNGKLAVYLEKVNYLEAMNKSLLNECEQLRKVKGMTGERIKEAYEDELKDARETIAELNKEIAPLEAKIISLKDQVDTVEDEKASLQKMIDQLNNTIATLNAELTDQEAETKGLRRQCEALERERDMLKKDVANVREDNNRLRCDLEAARVRQINAENERDAYLEELEFIKKTTDEEISELKALFDKLKSIQPQMEKMWQSEFKECLRSMNEAYDQQLQDAIEQQRIRFEDKLHSLQQGFNRDNTDSTKTKIENKQIKDQLKDLKDRMNDLERELRLIENNQRRDHTDSVSSTEVKNLKSSISDLKRQIQDLESENEALRRKLDLERKQRQQECEECAREKEGLALEIEELRSELASISADFEELQSSKLDLVMEISCYKKLLEGEENKIRSHLEDQQNMQSSGGATLSSVISKGLSSSSSGGGGGGGGRGSSSGGQSSQSSKAPDIRMTQSQGRVKITKSSSCDVGFIECETTGDYVVLSNENRSKAFDLTGYCIRRPHRKYKINANPEFKFPANYKLGPSRTVKVYAYKAFDHYESDKSDKKLAYDVFCGTAEGCKDFGGGDGECTLVNPGGDVKAFLKCAHLID